jgi:3D (Asp-Asp-Asp) domain-containing protein
VIKIRNSRITDIGKLLIFIIILCMIFIISIIHTQILFNKSVKNINYIKEKIKLIDVAQSDVTPKVNAFIPMNDFFKMRNESIEDKDCETTVPAQTFAGYFTITHYDICEKCCGKDISHPEYGITSTGVKATPYKTVAVDPQIIPYGTKVIINGNEYIAEDTGGAIKGYKIDICVASHSEALEKGRLANIPVYVEERA